jgi:hypothetical protein
MQMARYFDALTFGPQQTSVSLIDNQTNEPVIVFFSPPGAYHNMGYEYYILPAHSTTDANRDEGDFVWLGDKQYKVGDGGVGVVRYCDGHKGAREIVDSRGRQRAADSNTNWPTGDLISQMPESK